MSGLLQTERHTAVMQRRVLRAARLSTVPGLGRVGSRRRVAFFEHGQWWLQALDTGQTWSVVDADGAGAVDGFDFEEIAAGVER